MKSNLFLLASLALGCVFLLIMIFHIGGTAPSNFNAQAACRVTDFYLILDTSDSMAQDSGPTTKINAATTAINNFVDNIASNPSDRITLITFAEAGWLSFPLTTDYNLLKQTVIQTRGDLSYRTCVQCGINTADNEDVKDATPSAAEVAILATDGEANWTNTMVQNVDPLDPSRGIPAAITAADNAHSTTGMKFYTIGFGTPGVSENFDFLKTIASDTGGQYYYSPTSNQIDRIYQQIATENKCLPPPTSPTPSTTPPPPPFPGNISNLNFGITDLLPWFQGSCGDIREDNGIVDNVPSGQVINASGPSCPDPAIAFTGDTDIDQGQGKVSTTGQIVGGSSYHEVFPTNTQLDTSYTSLLTKAQNANITPTKLASVCTLSNCTLPNNLLHGIYLATGPGNTPINVNLKGNRFKNKSNYIFLINGNLTINGDISVPSGPNGSTVLFATAGNIIVAPTVTNIDGWYIAGRSFNVSTQGNCNDVVLNVAGTVVANAMNTGGAFQNYRDLCGNDTTTPVITFTQRLDMILNAPEFLKQQKTISQELAP